MITIEPLDESAWTEAWALLQPVCAQGDTLAHKPDIAEADAHAAWVTAPLATFVARDENRRVVGLYYLKANYQGLGSHVANAGYVVSQAARGRGIAAQLCEHSQAEAKRRGFESMQFNYVVSTNEAAVHLWQKMGFSIVGRVPEAFRHKERGLVDVLVMWKRLA